MSRCGFVWFGAALLVCALADPPAHAQCGVGGAPVSHGTHIEHNYGTALAGSAAGGGLGAASGALLGMLVPALFCSAGIGDDGCETAWMIGLGGVGGAGLLLGSALGTMVALDGVVGEDTPFAAAGFGVLAGGAFVAGGALLADATGELAFLAAGFAGWALSIIFLTPLMTLVIDGAPDCPTAASSPLSIRY